MSTPQMDEAIDNCDRFYTVLKSIDAFNEMEVRGVVHGVLSPTLVVVQALMIYLWRCAPAWWSNIGQALLG